MEPKQMDKRSLALLRELQVLLANRRADEFLVNDWLHDGSLSVPSLVPSRQAISHPTLELIAGNTSPDIAVMEGKFNTINYGLLYRYDGQYIRESLTSPGRYVMLTPQAVKDAYSTRAINQSIGRKGKNELKLKNAEETQEDEHGPQERSRPWIEDLTADERVDFDKFLISIGTPVEPDLADGADGRADGGGEAGLEDVQDETVSPSFALGRVPGIRGGRPEPAGDGGGRGAGRSLAPLEGAPVVAGATGPDTQLVAVAEEYARSIGIDLIRRPLRRLPYLAPRRDLFPGLGLDPEFHRSYDKDSRPLELSHSASRTGITPTTMKLLTAAVALLTASCATPEVYSTQPMKAGGKNSSYSVEDHPDGFTLALNYSRYQFIPESNAVAVAARSELLATAHEVAEGRGKEIKPINEQRIRQSMGRNGVTGMTSWSGSVRAFYR